MTAMAVTTSRRRLLPGQYIGGCTREEEKEIVLNVASTHNGHVATITKGRTVEKEFNLHRDLFNLVGPTRSNNSGRYSSRFH
jgi:hypothetical protein